VFDESITHLSVAAAAGHAGSDQPLSHSIQQQQAQEPSWSGAAAAGSTAWGAGAAAAAAAGADGLQHTLGHPQAQQAQHYHSPVQQQQQQQQRAASGADRGADLQEALRAAEASRDPLVRMQMVKDIKQQMYKVRASASIAAHRVRLLHCHSSTKQGFSPMSADHVKLQRHPALLIHLYQRKAFLVEQARQHVVIHACCMCVT
jgi:hypothetical protein